MNRMTCWRCGARRPLLAWTLAAVLAIPLAACIGGPAPRPNVAVFDLGDLNPAGTPVAWLGSVDVAAPSWLDSRAMQYRLASEPARRQTFAENRWAATPAELLGAALRRQLGAGGTGCRLKVELDEWVQAFDATGDSRAQVAVRASLVAAKGDGLVARQTWQREQAAGRDPRQGVAAFAALERTLASDLGQWLAQQEKEQKDLAARCRP